MINSDAQIITDISPGFRAVVHLKSFKKPQVKAQFPCNLALLTLLNKVFGDGVPYDLIEDTVHHNQQLMLDLKCERTYRLTL